MKRYGKCAALILNIALSLGIVASGFHSSSAEASAAALVQQGNVLRATLDNGLRVVIVRDTLAPTVTTQITYMVGGYEAPRGFPGTAHALEHMMFRNSKGMTSAQLYEMIGKMGAHANAFTTEDATQYFFAAPAQYVNLLLKIESIRMRGAQLSGKDWSLEKGAIEQEVSRDISNPDYLAMQEAEELLYAGTGYAEGALGSRPTFDKTTGTILRNFYNRWYEPDNAVLVIVGDVGLHATMTKVKQLFGPIKSGNVPEHRPVKLEPFQSKTIAKTTPDATGRVEFIYRVPGKRSSDYAAMQVLMTALNNARSDLSGLAAQGKVLNAGAGAQSFVHGGMGMVGVGFAKGSDPKVAQAYLQGAVDKLIENGVSADLVAAAKRKALAGLEFSKNSSMGLAGLWSEALAWRGLNSPREALDQIEKVTPADVDRVARKYLDKDRRITVVLTPSPNGKRPPHSLGFGGTEKFAGDTKLAVPLPGWASKELSSLQMPKWTLDPVRMKLANGITLIVQPENISKTVAVFGRIDHDDDLQAPKGQEGVGRLLDMLFPYGTAKLDRDAFHKALDQIAAGESGGSIFHLSVLSDHFDRGMQLLAANELSPALPQEAFRVKQQALAHMLAGRLKSPRYKAKRAVHEGLLPAGDPALREATPATVSGLTLGDVKRYYAQTYRPDMTTIVIVGDVTPAQAKAVVGKYFGGWKAVGPKPDVIPAPVPVNPASYTVVPDPYASQDQVLMGQMLSLNPRNTDRYALKLGNEVLGGNGFASRLMVDIRSKHGYAYGAGSSMGFHRSRSMFFVSYASDPDKVAAVDGLVRKNLEAMRNTPVSSDELTNAKQAIIRSIPLQVSSVMGIASHLLTWSYKGLPLNEPMIAASHYVALSPSDVMAAFRKYVHPDRLVQVVVGPKPAKH